MFDWDDQELANIIWGESGEADDHIVPYPEDIEKKDLRNYVNDDRTKLNEEETNSKAAEQQTSTSKTYSDAAKGEDNDSVSASRVTVDPQLNLPSFSASKTDDNDIAKRNQLDIGPEISENQHDDNLGELVGNNWANIGSFDDLDRILSNDDLDGQTSLGSADDLWTTSKDLISETAKSSSQVLGSTSWEFGSLRNSSAHFDINSEYLHDENHSASPGCQSRDAISSCSQRNIGRHVEQKEYAVRMTGMVKEDTYDSWTSSAANVPQFDSDCAPATVQNYQASVPRQKRLAQDSSSMAYQRFSDPYVAPYAYGTLHPAMLKPTDDEHQPRSSYSEAGAGNVASLNKSVKVSVRPVKMTPQEKIEKLRRRQQMRAMLAIQKQQQQLDQQASDVDYSLSQKSCEEDQFHHIKKTDVEADENLSTHPCYDPGSPNKRDDSSSVADIDDYSAEDTVLYQLQDVIARLDLNIRLCVRDSLFRLANSATQRSNASDTSSKNRSGICEPDVAKEEMSDHDRFAGKVNVETDTNHIDRVVAHLLFHRPFKLSVNNLEKPESSTSTKVSIEQETAAASSLPVGCPSKSSEIEYNLSPHGSKTSRPFVDSSEEYILNNQTEMTINPQMNQKMTEQGD